MKHVRRWLPLLFVLGLVIFACGWLLQLRLGGGDVYPAYSSLRADALGTRALYEALEQVPGVQVERDYRPLPKLAARPRLVMLAGLEWQDWTVRTAEELTALNAAAASGARVVLAFHADLLREARDQKGHQVKEEESEDEKREREKKEQEEARRKKRLARMRGKRGEWLEIEKTWGVAFKQRWLMARRAGAQRADDADPTLPAELPWKSDLYFVPKPESGWQVLYRRAGEPVLLEKRVGQGSIVLMSDAFCLSNESMHASRATELLSWVVGSQRDVVFMESTLGVLEETGVGHLARRYGLHGAMALCVLLGLLYAWRQVVAFLPPLEHLERGGEVALAYEPTAGFTSLLRRSLAPGALLESCVTAWRRGRRAGTTPAATERLEAAWRARDPKQPLSTTYNALVRALKPR